MQVVLSAGLGLTRRLHRIGLGLVGLAAGVVLILLNTLPTDPSVHLVPASWLDPFTQRDGVAYPAHAALGTALGWVGGDPERAATQWLKAASHARSEAEVARAAEGIAAARRRGDGRLDGMLCAAAMQAVPAARRALELAGGPCNFDPLERYHVGAGPIRYRTDPPGGGPHFEAWYPTYGVAEEPINPGLWVHNLEHGAIVLLYDCPERCPDLVVQLRELHASLPPGRNARRGAARLLATPYPGLRGRIVVVSWHASLQLEALDRERILTFYEAHLDRGPECRQQRCPD